MSDPDDRSADADWLGPTVAAEEETTGRPDGEPPAEDEGGTEKPDGATGH